MDFCVVTIAVGNSYYYDLAENLLISFLLWNEHNQIEFLLLTDNTDYFKAYQDIAGVRINHINLADSDKSFTSKFLLYEHALAEENLFVDCDCLIYQDLSFIFDEFRGHDFSVVGNDINSGDFFCNVKAIINKFGLIAMPKFVGSVYYFRKNMAAKKIFDNARQLQERYDEYGFVRLRGKENEEPLFAVAMGINGAKAISNSGEIKADLMYYKKVDCNVLKGFTQVNASISTITGGELIPAKSQPAILHFNGSFSDNYRYNCESYRLHHQQNKLMVSLVCTYIKSSAVMGEIIRNILRPAYRFIVGYRPVSKSSRI